MQKLSSVLVGLMVAGLVLGLGGVALAGPSDDITVTYQVTAINELTIGADVSLTVDAATTAGVDPDQASDSSTYDITTNCAADAKKITGVLDTDMPTDLTLKVNAAAPSAGATSAGAVTLSATPADLVTLIDAVAAPNLTLAFTLDALATAGVVGSASKTLTMTIVDTGV